MQINKQLSLICCITKSIYNHCTSTCCLEPERQQLPACLATELFSSSPLETYTGRFADFIGWLALSFPLQHKCKKPVTKEARDVLQFKKLPTINHTFTIFDCSEKMSWQLTMTDFIHDWFLFLPSQHRMQETYDEKKTRNVLPIRKKIPIHLLSSLVRGKLLDSWPLLHPAVQSLCGLLFFCKHQV